MYEDKGLMHKVDLRKLISVRLENCDSSYVDEIIGTSNKLCGIGFYIDDEWFGAILLAGLTEQYKPFIMSFEGSTVKITGDIIKQKLLDTQVEKSASEVFFPRKKPNNSKGKSQGFKGKNHENSECKFNKAENNGAKNADKNAKKHSETVKGAFTATFMTNKSSDNDWYVDSGASSHVTPHADFIEHKVASNVKEIVTANNSKMPVAYAGPVSLNFSKN